MIVTGQIVNGKEVTLCKKYIANVRAAIHQLGENKDKLTLEEFNKLKKTIQGKVNYIKKYNGKKGAFLESYLKKINDAEEFILKK